MKKYRHTSILGINKSAYDTHWKYVHIFSHTVWSHWNIVKRFIGVKNLELGGGLSPRIPIRGNYFLDVSSVAIEGLKQRGAHASFSDLADKIPYKDNYFHLVCAFELLEHLPNDEWVIDEVYRVLRSGGTFIASFPLHMSLWSEFDQLVGHVRRYDPKHIESIFSTHGFYIVEYGIIRSPWPGRFLGQVLRFMHDNAPIAYRLYGQIRLYLSTTTSRFFMKISTRAWTKESPQDLTYAKTVLLVMKKM